MNWFLLIAGDNYYPETYTACFPTFDDAVAQVTYVVHKRKITKGAKKGEEEITHTNYSINGREYDWFDIVDLREWVGGER